MQEELLSKHLWLAYKAEGAGCRVVFVDPENTTQECSNCHEIVKKDLTERMHDCPFCGLSINRDFNAARNILIRATQGHCGSNACNSLEERDAAVAASVKQEAQPIYRCACHKSSYEPADCAESENL
jgi:transposase